MYNIFAFLLYIITSFLVLNLFLICVVSQVHTHTQTHTHTVPEVHRNVMNYMLRFMVQVSEQHADNGISFCGVSFCGISFCGISFSTLDHCTRTRDTLL